ncbi:ribonuclease R, partial [Bacteroidota bacterium]
KAGYVVGTIDIKNAGYGFLQSDEIDEDVFISQKNLNKALNKDVVKVYCHAHKKNGRLEGEVVEIIKREKTSFVGSLEISKNFAFLVPDSKDMPYDLFIPLSKLKGAQDGDKAIAKISNWPDKVKNPFGEIIEVLGKSGEHEAEMHAILAEFELPNKFPEDVENETSMIKEEIGSEEIAKRRDFRNIPTFTIDPEDAKDFDDALSFKILDNGNYQVGVHIADVTHYVHQKSMLDDEALARGTSVYLVDRVVPMLPEKLSNKVCSLRPDEEKLCFSVVFELTANGEVLNEWFGRTVIRSNHRFTYDEAQKVIDNKEGDLQAEISHLHELAQKLRKKRFDNGSIAFEKLEVKFHLNESGKPTGIFQKEYKESNQLIEEFMLLANKRVAEFIGKKKEDGKAKTFVYRIHDKPNQNKLQSFNFFIKKFGYNLSLQSKNSISRSLNELLEKVKGKSEQNIVENLAVRAMAKAEYATDNIGHYGLSFEHYAHFTSPIRRYPDILVHRLLSAYLNGAKSKNKEKYEAMCKHCSEMERIAIDAERASIKYKQVEFMMDKTGKEFNSIISGVTDWGLFVEVDENKCEGLVSMRELDDDFYIFDEENYCLIGKFNNKRYQLGDPIVITVLRANLSKKQLDFGLANSSNAANKSI